MEHIERMTRRRGEQYANAFRKVRNGVSLFRNFLTKSFLLSTLPNPFFSTLRNPAPLLANLKNTVYENLAEIFGTNVNTWMVTLVRTLALSTFA